MWPWNRLEQAHMIMLGQWNEEREDVMCFSLPLICSHILHIHSFVRSVGLISAELLTTVTSTLALSPLNGIRLLSSNCTASVESK